MTAFMRHSVNTTTRVLIAQTRLIWCTYPVVSNLLNYVYSLPFLQREHASDTVSGIVATP